MKELPSSYRIAFLCASALYLNVTTPADAAYKEEWGGNQKLHAYTLAHPDARSKPATKDRVTRDWHAVPRKDNGPIAAFAGHPAALPQRAAPKRPFKQATPHEVHDNYKAGSRRKINLVGE
ncbi:hypothetical protein [Burkholderia stagnalis]